MRKIIGIRDNPEQNMYVELKDLERHEPIFAKKDGKFIGMVMQSENGKHWFLYNGKAPIAFALKINLLKEGLKSGIEFYAEA